MNLSKPELQFLFSDQWHSKSSVLTDLESAANSSSLSPSIVSERCRRGNVFTLKEIEMVTNGFAEENMIRTSGDNGVIYRAVLLDNRRAAVKSLISSR